MNNQAALLTENGLYKEALEVLDNTLKTMQEILRNDGQEALEHVMVWRTALVIFYLAKLIALFRLGA
jgi:hypothetical protein